MSCEAWPLSWVRVSFECGGCCLIAYQGSKRENKEKRGSDSEEQLKIHKCSSLTFKPSSLLDRVPSPLIQGGVGGNLTDSLADWFGFRGRCSKSG